jgi:predicted MFS family arabinose efflux permease
MSRYFVYGHVVLMFVTVIVNLAVYCEGMGFAAYYMVAAVHVQFYFDKRRALAVSLMMTGLSAGSFFWPLFSQWLISHYGWRGAVTIQASLHLHLIPIALLLRPPTYRNARKRTQQTLTMLSGVCDQPQTSSCDASNMLLTENNIQQSTRSTHDSGGEALGDTENLGRPTHPQETNDDNLHEKSTKQADQTYGERVSTDILLVSNSEDQQQQQQQNDDENKDRGQGHQTGSNSSSQWQQMMQLLGQPAMLAYCVTVYFVHQGHLGVLTFLSVRGLGVGATASKAAFILSIAALFNGSLRIPFGYLGDKFGHLRLCMYGCSACE